MESPSIQTLVGIVYIFLGTTLTPVYGRVIYIFASHKRYRTLECYRIMIQIGIVQCIWGPAAFFIGLTQILNNDYFMLANSVAKIATTSIRIEAVLSLILALNRLKIICGLLYPSAFHMVLIIATWIFGAIYASLLFTPYCGYTVVPGEYLPKYDLSLPYTALLMTVGSALLGIATLLSAVIYIVIVIYLVYKKHHRSSVNTNFQKEKTIFLYAVVRFSIDITLAVIYNYVDLTEATWTDLPVFTGYILNNLAVSPILYLCIYKSVRKDFWGRRVKKQSVTAMAMYPNQNSRQQSTT
ncbi:hypothetical protein QR680_010200 [Steinernema hermaphroditum]|uniref:7TM GPCR serpentine receptor class x (Srx) domain-containing protein n=1 Tax=Steinernema hermaphroditum TaxID=289476 RepID=A0AA39MA90_9BILA|nr:hypothetical protein QR680_010200 [Steinernema hermaphroditum]